MALDVDPPEYTSPLRKLVTVFRRSRDLWKQKYVDVKRAKKLGENQVRAVERSREHWKKRARAQERRIQQLEAELQKTADDTI